MSDAAAEYEAATSQAGVIERSDRALVRMYGRDPLKMIQGLITNDLAGAPDGQAVYAALLTPKGRMVADLRALKQPPDVLLDVDREALENLVATLKKFVPPLFARFEDLTDARTMLGLYGPAARDAAIAIAGGAPPPDAPEHAFVASGDLVVLRTHHTGATGGYDVIGPALSRDEMWSAALKAGAHPISPETLDVLRIEAGRPVWGRELGDDVIPLEAGLRERAISQTKGCYTGQEVIIRILHRGHVNRHLRGLLLGALEAPPPDTPLFRAEDGKAMGRVTSACISPRLGQTIGMGYVRREIEPPGAVRLGAPDGPEITVVELPFEG